MTSNETPIPNGGAWAAILAAAFGCFCFGVAVNLSEAFSAVKSRLNLYNPAGDLTGKSAVGVATWLIAWALLHWLMKSRSIRRSGVLIFVSILLIVASIAIVCPPVVDLITAKLNHLPANKTLP